MSKTAPARATPRYSLPGPATTFIEAERFFPSGPREHYELLRVVPVLERTDATARWQPGGPLHNHLLVRLEYCFCVGKQCCFDYRALLLDGSETIWTRPTAFRNGNGVLGERYRDEARSWEPICWGQCIRAEVPEIVQQWAAAWLRDLHATIQLYFNAQEGDVNEESERQADPW